MKHIQSFFYILLFLSGMMNAQTNGNIDTSFVIGTGFYGSFNSTTGIITQPDNKIIVVGGFSYYNGVNKNNIVRLNPDGTLDTSFNINTGLNSYAETVALQTDGKILVGGIFTAYNGTNSRRLIRINSDGSVDTSFNIGTGFNNLVKKIAIQPDGKIIVVGGFTNFNSTSQNRIARINTDGTLDTTFSIGTGFNKDVWEVIIQPDGKILVGGDFTTFDGSPQNRMVRLNEDGTIDSTFDIGSGFGGSVRTFAVQPDGKILVGGLFTTYDGSSKNRMIRLNSDGTQDVTFNIGSGFNNTVGDIMILQNGKAIIGGDFTSFDNNVYNHIMRLNNDGTADVSFESGTGFNNNVYLIAGYSDSSFLVGGIFTSYNGTTSKGIIRLQNSCIVNIPDANFKNYLVNNPLINTNGDSEIQCEEALAFTGTIDVNDANISDLTGIEAFVNITELNAHNNQLVSVNLSSNVSLAKINLGFNQLTSLDVTHNLELTELICWNNQLTALDVSQNVNLSRLSCNFNQLTTLDVTQNTALTYLNCRSNQLTTIDLSQNTTLERLYCFLNQLETLDLRNNVALTRLECYDNQLISLYLNNGNNNNMLNDYFKATNNPDLTCIQVDDAAWSTANWTDIDTTASFSENCSDISVVTFNDVTITYDGNAHEISAENIPNNVSVAYEITSPDNQTTVGNSATNAGIYQVKAILSSAYGEEELTATLTINKAQAVITADEVQTHTYDGDIKNVTATLDHTETNLVYAPQQGYADAGNYNITISAEETANYLAINREVSLVIEKADFTGITFEDATVTYDGNAHSIFVVDAPACANVTYTNNAQTNAGTYTVTATVSQANYNDLVLTADLVIEKAQAIITAEETQIHTYDGNIKDVIASLNHTETDLIYTPQQGYSDEGSYQITVSALESANYLATSTEVTLIIEPNLNVIDIVKTLGIKAFPNPVEKGKIVTILVENPQSDMVFKLYSTDGQYIKEIRSDKKETSFEIPNNLLSGMYLIHCTVGHQTKTFKVLVK